MAQPNSEEAFLSEDALRVVQIELAAGGVNVWSGTTSVCPSLKGVTQAGNQCQEMAET